MAMTRRKSKALRDSMVHDVDRGRQRRKCNISDPAFSVRSDIRGVWCDASRDGRSSGSLADGAIHSHFIHAGIGLDGPTHRIGGIFYFYFVSDHEPEIAKLRTPAGKVVTFVVTFAIMQVTSVLLWAGLAKAFSLH